MCSYIYIVNYSWNDFRFDDRGGQFCTPPRPIHRLGNCWFRYCLTTRWSEGVLRHAGNTSDDVSVDERSLRGQIFHVAKVRREYHLSDVAGRCTVQWVGHQWHHIIRLRKSIIGSYIRLVCILSWFLTWMLELLIHSRWTKCKGTDALQACCLVVSRVAGGGNAVLTSKKLNDAAV
jgi:hypothetical protein